MAILEARATGRGLGLGPLGVGFKDQYKSFGESPCWPSTSSLRVNIQSWQHSGVLSKFLTSSHWRVRKAMGDFQWQLEYVLMVPSTILTAQAASDWEQREGLKPGTQTPAGWSTSQGRC